MICCLDLEGVMIPEIWINVARKTKIEALKKTTRDEPNYDRLMQYRINILKKNGIKLKDIQAVIKTMKPLPGAKSFLSKIKKKHEIIILSDTFYEFAGPLMRKLDNPTLFCNSLKIDRKGFISGYKLRQKDGKAKAVKAIKGLGFEVTAAGDSYNDITMLKNADNGILFKPPKRIIKEFPKYKVTYNYTSLLKGLK